MSKRQSLAIGHPAIEKYLAPLPPAFQAALQQLRRTIRAAAPEAIETISYRLPAFDWHGSLVAFGAASKHCALYVMSGTALDAFQQELEAFDLSKGTVRFSPDKPIPATLVRRIVKARMLENELARKKRLARKSRTRSKSRTRK